MPNSWARKLDHFARLSDDDRRHLNGLIIRQVAVDADTDIISDGAVTNAVHVMIEGYACRYKLLPDGRRQIMAYLLPGDICDLHIFILKRMDHAIGALSPCRIVRVPREEILGMLETRPALARALWWATLQDEAILRGWLINMGRRDAYARIAHILCELYLRLRVVGLTNSRAFDLPVTQTELADTLGLTPVSVNRALQRLRHAGLIVLKGRALTLINLQGLADAAEFDPSYLHLNEAIVEEGVDAGREARKKENALHDKVIS